MRKSNYALRLQPSLMEELRKVAAEDQTTINQGRVLFFKAGCQTCHGGGKWSNSFRDFQPPPAGATDAGWAIGVRL